MTGRIWVVTAAATICRICLALLTYGTNDASMWESSAKVIQNNGGRSIYQKSVEVQNPQGQFLHHQVFNHPPMMIRVLSSLNAVKAAVGMPIRTSIRLLDAAADVGTVVLTAAILRHMFGSVPMWPMILVVSAPSWIFISGFHANTDPWMVFFLVLSVYLFQVRGQNAWGCLSFAFATGIKIVPILLLPALLLWLRTWSDRVRALLILTVFWIAISMPWLVESPMAMVHTMLGYRSYPGHWGIGLLLTRLPIVGAGLAWRFDLWGVYILLVVLLLAAWLMNRGENRVALFYQFGVLFMLFLVLTPGFGIQYLVWLSPWIAALSWRAAAAHLAANAGFCTAVYTYWCRGLPWYYADSITVGDWRGPTALLGLATWFTALVTLVAYWRCLGGTECLLKNSTTTRRDCSR